MALPPNELVPVDQMDPNTRPYFIHHRNQVGINTALMDLFRLIDFFLQSDPGAQDCLDALRTISDYCQSKQVIAPMPNPNDLIKYYDDQGPVPIPTNPQDLLGETLRNLFSRIPIPPNSPPPHVLAHGLRDMHPYGRLSTLSGREPSTLVSSPINVGEGVKEVRLSTAQPILIHPNPTPAQSIEDVSCIEIAKSKLRSWLAKPETRVLKRWASGKSSKSSTNQSSSNARNSTRPSTLHYSFAPTLPATPAVNTEFNIPRTRTVSFSGVPNSAPPHQDRGHVHMATETVVEQSETPPRRQRAMSLSQGKNLPPLPSRDNSSDGVRSAESSNGPEAKATKLRKHRPSPIGGLSFFLIFLH